jgi:hypothetical protein
MQVQVKIAGPDHIINRSGMGFVIYAEWEFMDEGTRRTTHQKLDGALTRQAAEDARKRWQEALS